MDTTKKTNSKTSTAENHRLSKDARYLQILEQLDALFARCGSVEARLTTVAAVLHHKMDNFLWTGYYIFRGPDLIVGPYQGTLACMVLKKNVGVCWAAVNQRKVMVVPDVHVFDGHIMCDSRSNSEIVAPLYNESGEIVGVLDIDSTEYSNFDDIDAKYLVEINKLVYKKHERI